MIHRTRLLGVLLGLVSLTVYAAAQGNIRATIEAESKRFTTALKQGDAATIAAMYTTDAKALPPNGATVAGRAAIQRLWQGAIDGGMRDAVFTVVEVEQKGDIVYEVGKYAVNDGAGKEVDTGKYIVIWKREKGKWRLHRDIWNSDMPALPAAPAK